MNQNMSKQRLEKETTEVDGRSCWNLGQRTVLLVGREGEVWDRKDGRWFRPWFIQSDDHQSLRMS